MKKKLITYISCFNVESVDVYKETEKTITFRYGAGGVIRTKNKQNSLIIFGDTREELTQKYKEVQQKEIEKLKEQIEILNRQITDIQKKIDKLC